LERLYDAFRARRVVAPPLDADVLARAFERDSTRASRLRGEFAARREIEHDSEPGVVAGLGARRVAQEQGFE